MMKNCLFMLLIVSYGAAAQFPKEVTLPRFHDTTETVFGIEIYDPFREMENNRSPARASWLTEKNQQADLLLNNVPEYRTIGEEVNRFSDGSPVRGYVPVVNDGRIYALQFNSELDVEQIVSYESPSDSGTVLLTTTTINAQLGAHYSISSFNPSPDNRYLAVEIYNENDEMAIAVFDVFASRMEDIVDANISYYPYWLPNSQGFFYTQLSSLSDSVDLFDDVRIKLHRIGSSQAQDRLILSKESSEKLAYGPGDFPTIQILPDSVTARCALSRGISQYTEYFLVSLDELMSPDNKKANWRRLATPEDQVTKATFDTEFAYLLSAKDSLTTIVTKVDINNCDNAEEIASVTNGFVNDVEAREHAVYVELITDGVSSILQMDGNGKKEVPLPFPGDVNLKASGFPSKASGEGLFFGLSGWNTGYGIYYYDSKMDTVTRTNIRPAGVYDLPQDLVVEKVQVLSHDSVQVPMSIIYKKGLKRNDTNPTILEVYGAYGTSLESYLEVEMLAWYNRGGIVAKAHVRGGGEKGTNWHTQGKKAMKANSWKDLIACGQYLIDHQYTSTPSLGLSGASAGGITVGMAITERPDLFGAAVLQYPFLNPTRLASTIDGEIHYDEFGDPTDSVEFQYLYQMDPYLHIREGKKYPAVLLTAGINDTRVEVWEPAKFAAKLESVRDDDRVTLLKVYDNGHGASSTTEVNRQIRDYLAFFYWQLNQDDPND